MISVKNLLLKNEELGRHTTTWEKRSWEILKKNQLYWGILLYTIKFTHCTYPLHVVQSLPYLGIMVFLVCFCLSVSLCKSYFWRILLIKAGYKWTLKLSINVLSVCLTLNLPIWHMHLCSGKWISKQQEGLSLLLGKKLDGLSRHHTAQIVWCTIIFDPSANRQFLRITAQAQRLMPGEPGCSETVLKKQNIQYSRSSQRNMKVLNGADDERPLFCSSIWLGKSGIRSEFPNLSGNTAVSVPSLWRASSEKGATYDRKPFGKKSTEIS